MRTAAIFFVVAFASFNFIAACPVNECEDGIKSDAEDARKNDGYDACAAVLQKVDDCYAQVHGQECSCSDAELTNAAKWEGYVHEMYDDRYCEDVSKCKSQDALDCLDDIEAADILFFTKKSGAGVGDSDKQVIEDAKVCATKLAADQISVDGCGWNVATLKQDNSAWIKLWDAWLAGCEISPVMEDCEPSDFTTTICSPQKMDDLANCILNGVNGKPNCDSIPNTKESIISELYQPDIDQRCALFAAKDGCKKKKNELEDLKTLLARYLNKYK